MIFNKYVVALIFQKHILKHSLKLGDLIYLFILGVFWGGHCLTYLSGGAFILETSNAFKP